MHIIRNMDWALFRRQKQELLDIIEETEDIPTRVDLLNGVVALLDGLQDYAVDREHLSEEDVFGESSSKGQS